MFWLAVTLMLASPAQDDGPQAVRVTTTLVVERIPLPQLRGPIELVVNSVAARMELNAPRDAAAVAARISSHAGAICPRVTARPNGVELRCRTRRLDAILTSEGGKRFLDIHELRGLPWRDGVNGPPPAFYEPFRVGLGSGCPGDTAAGRGECALRDGKQLEAAAAFRDALGTKYRQMASVRLGDIALGTGDPTTAAGWYQRAGTLGVFGRVARARLCELDGECLGSSETIKRAFDPAGLPEPVRADIFWRAVRANAYLGRFDSSVTMMRDQFQAGGVDSVCRGREMLCRRMVLEALRFQLTVPSADPYTMLIASGRTGAADDEASRQEKEEQARKRAARELAEATIEVYMALQGWDHGALAVELATAAADLAGHIGAPIFGGNLLAMIAPQVPAAALPDHLLRSAELFLQGREVARARVVIEYLSTRPNKGGRPQSARLASIQEALTAQMMEEDAKAAGTAPAESPGTIDPAAILEDLNAAAAAGARSKTIIGKLETAAGKAQGEKK